MILKTIDLVYPFPLKNKENEALKCDYLKDHSTSYQQNQGIFFPHSILENLTLKKGVPHKSIAPKAEA